MNGNMCDVLSDRELGTILAALRYWQRVGLSSGGPEFDIASSGGDLDSLAESEIDELCERLNLARTMATTTPIANLAAGLRDLGAKAKRQNEAGLCMYDKGATSCAEELWSSGEDLTRLCDSHDRLFVAMRELVQWAERTGGWDAPCWTAAQTAIDLACSSGQAVRLEPGITA